LSAIHAQGGQEQGTEPTIGGFSHQELGGPWRNPVLATWIIRSKLALQYGARSDPCLQAQAG